MKHKNMSDMIEEYIKRSLSDEGQVEIKRNELADLFNCVPSQINYVINTRFTIEHGYTVESKRGGGGYIRIVKLQIKSNTEMLDRMKRVIGNRITEKDAQITVQTLYDYDYMNRREAQIMLAAISQDNYTGNPLIDEQIRSNVLLSMIKLLILKNK